ncbi:MAG: hypothetical protein R2745_12385 [Vicinamibacterales bacterium]
MRHRPVPSPPRAEPSDLVLEQFRLGELDAGRAEALAARAACDAELAARLQDLARSDEAIRRDWPPVELARGLWSAGRTAAPRPVWRVWLAAPALVTMAVVASVWMRGPAVGPVPSPVVTVAPGGDRVKGDDAGLEIFRKTEAGSERLADGDAARPGDTLRVGYRVARRLYGLIVSVDGRGVVTRHLPAAGGMAVPLTPGATVLLDQAFELDDAPRVEQFHLVTAPEPFEVAPVLAALAAGAAGRLPPSLADAVVSVVKEPRP